LTSSAVKAIAGAKVSKTSSTGSARSK
jgi:hypothetical protein